VGYVVALDTTFHPAFAMQRPPCRIACFTVACALSTFACQPASSATLSDARRAAIADTLTTMIHNAYDLKAKDVVGRFMSLYPDTGRVISASGGHVTTTRAALQSGIKSFWEYVGRNMQDPKWEWGTPQVDVLSPDAAVVTTTYRIPHRTPMGEPHTVAGAWTAVFARRNGKWVIVQEHLSDVPAQALAADTSDVPPPAHVHQP
jgi:ketosteroid isomerase-like protein